MAITYYKRFRMEIDLWNEVKEASLPQGYGWIAWDESILKLHAEIKYRCFQSELDAELFPCLGDRYGCLRLMREIRLKHGFLPDATWLITCGHDVCGTVQGIVEPHQVGAIQNLGVLPEHRGRQLGRALLLKALAGFRAHGAMKARLEVTADNSDAVNLYRNVGFRKAKTVYKAADS